MTSRSTSLPPGNSPTAILSGEHSSDGVGSYLLVVDDHRDAADALVRLLSVLGREARAVYDGRACLAEIERQKPELVLIDMSMPEIDGIELARRIRERAEWNSVVLVALTGSGQEQDRARSEAAGYAAHLLKPVDLPLLEQTLARLLTPQSEAPQRGRVGGSGARSRAGGPAKR